MTNDEDLKRELLELDLRLRRKQEFWETPRNVAILVGVTAAIAAAIGFWLGARSAPPTPLFRRLIDGSADPMRTDQFIDAVQTAGIVVIAAMLSYVVVRLSRALTTASEKVQGALSDVMKQQNQLEQNVRRVWERIDMVESRLNRLEGKE